jgi:adenine phosphoribosyltransferase
VRLENHIQDIPDFPKPGIVFKDITPLLLDPHALDTAVEGIAEWAGPRGVEFVVAAEARGFVLGASIARELGAGFVPARKPGKLPSECATVSYDLEYGQDALQMHRDAVGSGHRVVIADDLLATGGTASAVVRLVEELGGHVVGLAFVVELEFLPGRQKLQGYDVRSLLKYQS